MDWGSILGSGGGSVSAGSGSGALYGAGMAGGLIGGLYQPFISQHWAANAGNQQFDLDRWWAVNQASLAVKGLRKAGINPLLAVTKGMPSGGGDTGVPYASFDSDGDVIGRGVSSGKAAASVRDQLGILRDQRAILSNDREASHSRVLEQFANTNRAEAEAKISEANRDIVNATKDASISSAKSGAGQQASLDEQLRLDLTLQRAQLNSGKAMADFDASPAGLTLQRLNRASAAAQGVLPVIREIRR